MMLGGAKRRAAKRREAEVLAGMARALVLSQVVKSKINLLGSEGLDVSSSVSKRPSE